MPLKIGDTLYCFDINRRVYPAPEAGRIWASGGPIYSEHYYPLKIVGENRVSWLLERGGKAPKKDADRIRKKCLTKEERDEDVWATEHRYRIARLLEQSSPEHLRETARILGYREDQ